MSPNAGLVRSFPQTSIKAPRKAGPSGGPRGVGIVTACDGLSQMSVAEMCGRSVCIAQRKDRRRNLRWTPPQSCGLLRFDRDSRDRPRRCVVRLEINSTP